RRREGDRPRRTRRQGDPCRDAGRRGEGGCRGQRRDRGMTAPDPAERVAVGRITRAHGVHGFVAVLPLTDVPERFDPGSTLFIGDSEETAVVAERRGQEHRPLVRFEGVPDRTAADRLAGEYLFVPATASPELPEGEFWPHQLLGLRIVTETGADLG